MMKFDELLILCLFRLILTVGKRWVQASLFTVNLLDLWLKKQILLLIKLLLLVMNLYWQQKWLLRNLALLQLRPFVSVSIGWEVPNFAFDWDAAIRLFLQLVVLGMHILHCSLFPVHCDIARGSSDLYLFQFLFCLTHPRRLHASSIEICGLLVWLDLDNVWLKCDFFAS